MNLRNHMLAALGAVAATGLVLPVTSSPADACGGFFCNREPIDQAGEEIVFGVDEGRVTAHIKIAYTGEAEDFAWVVPVLSVPTINVGTTELFTELGWRTKPRFEVQWNEDSECNWFRYDMMADASGVPSASGGEGNDGSVTVLQQAEVGPYNTVVLESTNAAALVAWLNENGFDQPEESTPLIDHYLQKDMKFVALKLKQDQGTGDIQPVVFQFEESEACVPLVLTQIAAMPDMPVRVYVLGQTRSVPTNWMHVVVNPKKIDWVGYSNNYEDVVTQAIDEAAGHGFVTEFAGQHAEMVDKLLWWDGRYDVSGILATTHPADAMMALIEQGFRGNPKMLAILQRQIPLPQELQAMGVTEQSFYNNMQDYRQYLDDEPFDAQALVDELEEAILAPLRDAQEMLEKYPYMTRMLTKVSPEEMTRDPLFAFNPDLPEVPVVRTAEGEVICGADGQPENIILTFANGERMEIDPDTVWNGMAVDGAAGEPAADRVELMGTSGDPVAVAPAQVAAIDAQLDTKAPTQVVQDLRNNQVPQNVDSSGSGVSGCSTGHLPVTGGVVLLMLIGLVALRRREV